MNTTSGLTMEQERVLQEIVMEVKAILSHLTAQGTEFGLE